VANHPVFTTYLRQLSAVTLQGDAREQSFYPALEKMLGEIANATGRAHVRVTILPKPTASAFICDICGFGPRLLPYHFAPGCGIMDFHDRAEPAT
jgi:hypothetical protein